MRKIFLNVDNLMLQYDIKLDNKHNFKLIFRWDDSFRIQRTDSIKDIYILKETNKTRLERIYADNRLKRFKIKNVENLLMKQIKIHEILNITSENSIDAIRKTNIINKNVRVDDKVRNKITRNIVESSNVNS